MARMRPQTLVLAWVIVLCVIGLGFVGTVGAQAPTVKGILRQVDPATLSFMVNDQTFSFTGVSVIYEDDTRIAQFSTLQQFVGTVVAVRYAAVGAQQVAGRVDILISPAQEVSGILTSQGGHDARDPRPGPAGTPKKK